jgi:hypothetical protein
MPFSFAYAIIRHRVFDIRVLIRQGLRYAAARGLLLSMVPLMAAILLADLLLHREQPLVAVVRERGWIDAMLAGVAFTLHASRRQWLLALDRRFYRDRYDAQQLLQEVVGEIHRTRSFKHVAPQVVAKIGKALHAKTVLFFVREPHESNYFPIALAPQSLEHAPPPLSEQTKLISLLRVLGNPLELAPTQTGWLQQQVPQEEIDFFHRAGLELLIPVTMVPQHTEVLLALGGKRSEEPYTSEDRDLLRTIATSLALFLDQSSSAADQNELQNGFQECPACGTCYDAGSLSCARDDTRLIAIHVPRLLANRYRLERRVGRGGMGTVYEAADQAFSGA